MISRSSASSASLFSRSSSSSFDRFCGDGDPDAGEFCDDGNQNDPDACSNDCRRNPFDPCTDARECATLLCKEGICVPCTNHDQCPAFHRCVGTRCVPSSSSSATTLARCGDGTLTAPVEECDDRNTRDFDGCSADCFLERGTCGDGVIQKLLGETCEPSLHDPAAPYDCDLRTCTILSRFCGNAVLNSGEECDEGPRNAEAPGSRCRTNCSLARCGDGIVDPPYESCDDRNRLSGDGCSRSCQSERGGPAMAQTLPASVFEMPQQGRQYPLPGQMIPYGIYPLQPVHAPVGDTGPGAVAVMAAGAAAGFAWIRRRRKR